MPGISYYVNVKGNISSVCVIIIIARLRIVENNKSLDDKNAFGLLLFHLNLMIRFRLKNRLNPTHTHTLLRGKYFFICIFMLCLLLLMQLCGLKERDPFSRCWCWPPRIFGYSNVWANKAEIHLTFCPQLVMRRIIFQSCKKPLEIFWSVSWKNTKRNQSPFQDERKNTQKWQILW